MLTKQSIKKIFLTFFGEKKTQNITTFFVRFLINFHKNLIIDHQYRIVKYEIPHKHCFFGYYDIPSINKDEKYLLSHVTTSMDQKTIASIGYFNIKTQVFIKLADTHAWNTQQGSRLQWFDNTSIIFNDYIDNNYCCRIIDSSGILLKKIDYALYDISSDRRLGCYLNFELLNLFRPGYGYSCKTNVDLNTESNGIYLVDINNNSSTCIIELETIKNYHLYSEGTTKHYINHLKFSPNGEKIMFFHLWEENNERRSRLFVIDTVGKIIALFSDFTNVSHYTWKSNNELFITVITKQKLEYRLYNIFTTDYISESFLYNDGHPTFINSKEYITDTYPDKTGMQHIFLCKYGIKKYELVSIYHKPDQINEYRCDLHPRTSQQFLNFDSNSFKNRVQYILTKKDKINQIESKFDIYHTLTGNFPKNKFQIIKFYLSSLAYRDALVLNAYIQCKSGFKKRRYFNKLTRNNSSFIGNNVKIGHNLHIMHFSGINLGNDVIIGNNCTIYQQVTIGKEKGGYPIIGNNVTIFAGAKIFGKIKIGDNVIIGANAVVTKDVPNNTVIAGIPASILTFY